MPQMEVEDRVRNVVKFSTPVLYLALAGCIVHCMKRLNRQLYFKTSGIQLFIIVRDVTSGVHSLADLEYFSIEVST